MQDIYQEITDRMIAELEKGRIPWHCPWRPAEASPQSDQRETLPRNQCGFCWR